MSEIIRIEAGPRMSQAVVHGGLVYLSGQVATGATVTEQTTAVLAQIDALLAAAGTSKAKLLTANVWLTDITTFGELNAVWEKWVVPGATPSRATVEAKLATPEYKVEIAVVAVI
ncbi:RidA family protein [Segnochrobactraceae bacterium EtOH-i3]